MINTAWDRRVINHSSTQHPNLYKIFKNIAFIIGYATILISFNSNAKSGDASDVFAMCFVLLKY